MQRVWRQKHLPTAISEQMQTLMVDAFADTVVSETGALSAKAKASAHTVI